MKKFLSMLLTLCMLAGILSGCVTLDEPDRPLSTQGHGGTLPGSTGGTQPPEESTAGSAEATVEEAVLYDQDGIRITLKGLEIGGIFGDQVKFLLENDTERNIALSSDDCIVNDVMVAATMYIDAAAGKKANGTLTLLSASLETAGIDRIGSLICHARVMNTDSYETVADGLVLQFDTSLAGTFTQEIDDSGDVVADQDGVTVIAKTLGDSWLGNTVTLLVKNGTDKVIAVTADNISVNGFTLTGFMYSTVYPGTVCFGDIDLLGSGLEENEIDQIETVSFTLKVIDPETYSTLFETDEITLNVG